MPTTTTTKTTTTTAGGIARTVTVTTTVTTPAAAATVNSAEDFPRTVGDVTVEWLSALLGKEVASFETQVLDMGVLSDLGRLTLTYVDEKGPEAIIVKVAKGIDSSRMGAMESGSYKKELAFYESLQDQVPMRSPKCLATFKDKEKPDEWFCIVLEDMNTIGYTVMNQIDGLTLEQTRNLFVPITKMHGMYWKHDLVQQAWLSPPGYTNRPWYDTWCDSFRAEPAALWERWDAALRKANEAVPGTVPGVEDDLEGPELQALMALSTDPAKLELLSTGIAEILASRPSTLLHGDCRGDNLFLKDGTTDEFAFIDWQMLAAGAPGSELVQVLSSCYTRLDDYDQLDEVVADFHAKLIEASPDWVAKEYTLEMTMEDFRVSTILFFLGVVGQLASMCEAICPTSKDDVHPLWGLVAAWFPRVTRCMKQLGCAERATQLAERAEEGVPPV